MKKILWLVAITLVVVNILILHLFILKSQIPNDTAFILKSSLQTIINTAFIPLAASLVLSNIPFKKWSFKKKWSWLFPIFLIISALFALSDNGMDFNKIQSSPEKYISKGEFDAIQPSVRLNCDNLKEGTFESKGITHIREERREIQYIKATDRHYEFGIHWINNCEYFLQAYYQGSESQNVKITGIGRNSYDCVILKGNIAEKVRLKIQDESL